MSFLSIYELIEQMYFKCSHKDKKKKEGDGSTIKGDKKVDCKELTQTLKMRKIPTPIATVGNWMSY